MGLQTFSIVVFYFWKILRSHKKLKVINDWVSLLQLHNPIYLLILDNLKSIKSSSHDQNEYLLSNEILQNNQNKSFSV